MNWPLATSPWPHQSAGYDFARPLPAAMIAAGIGTGKTALSIAMQVGWGSKRSLILCPSSVRSVWRRELARHWPDCQAVILDEGSVRKRTETAAKAVAEQTRPIAIAVNYEACSLPPLSDWILSQRWDAVVLDESHLGGVKTDGSRTSRFVSQLTSISEHRTALSGTPLAHCPLNVYGQYRFLDPAVFCRDFPNYYDFAKHFGAPKQIRLRKRLKNARSAMLAAMANCFGADSPQFDAISEEPDYMESLPGIRHAQDFEDRIKPLTWRCTTSDVLALPEMIPQRREVTLAGEQQRVYDGLCSSLYAELSSGDCTTVNSPLTMGIRLQQICSGFIGCDGGGIYRFAKNPKRDALADLLREAGEPVVVFCRFIADLDTVEATCKELGLRYGELSHRRKDAMTNLATLAEDIDVAAVQPQSGGVGIDLTRASVGVWYSFPRSLPIFDQGVGRLWRPGTRGVRMYSLVAEKTIEEDIILTIDDRREITEGILNSLKRYIDTSINVCYNVAQREE